MKLHSRNIIKPPLVLISEHYFPSTGATAQLAADLVEFFEARSVSPVVVTSTTDATCINERIIRFPESTRLVKVRSKLVRGIIFTINCILFVIRNRDSFEDSQLLIYSNPPFIGLVGLVWKLVAKRPYLFILQDLFPRSALLAGLFSPRGFSYFLWRLTIRQVIVSSKCTVVLSASMAERAITEYWLSEEPTIISNWAITTTTKVSTQDSTIARAWNIQNELVVQYSGNFGALHDMLTLLEASRLLQGQPILFLFIGGGSKQKHIESYIEEYALENVRLYPYLPRTMLSEGLAVSDLSIVSLIPGAEDTVAPSKLYGILASGSALICVGKPTSDIQRLINQYSCGFTVANGDSLLLADLIKRCLYQKTLLQQYKSASEQAHSELPNREECMNKYYALLFGAHDCIISE